MSSPLVGAAKRLYQTVEGFMGQPTPSKDTSGHDKMVNEATESFTKRRVAKTTPSPKVGPTAKRPGVMAKNQTKKRVSSKG